MPTTFANTINGNEILAKRAERDYAGNDLQTTYATKSEVTTGLALKEDSANKAQTIDPSSSTDFPSSAATANYVNSSVATATANFLGNFTLAELGLTYPATDAQIGAALDAHTWPAGVTPTNNDYTYIEIENPQTTGIDDSVERFKFNGTNWVYEYTLNNSTFTAAEKAAIDSGIDSAKVAVYDAHVADTDIHVTLSDKSTWNAKQDAISDLATIRSGAQAGATAVQPGDLATVATTGAYSDLSGTPTIVNHGKIYGMDGTESYNDIYTKMTVDGIGITWVLDRVSPYVGKATYTACQLLSEDSSTNTHGFLRLTCVMRANVSTNQITVFMAEAWGGPNGFSTPTYSKSSTAPGSYNQVYSWNSRGEAIARNINEVPSYTTSEDGKVLGVVDNQGTAELQWVADNGVTDVEVDGVSVVSSGVASITMPTIPVTDVEVDGVSVVSSGVASITTPTVDQTYNSSSTNAQSGTAVAGAIANVNQVPASTSSDADKVLTVDAQGTPAWASAQAPISAGDGIDITNNVVSADVAAPLAINTDDEIWLKTGRGLDTQAGLQSDELEVRLSGTGGLMYDSNDDDGLAIQLAQYSGLEVQMNNGVQEGLNVLVDGTTIDKNASGELTVIGGGGGGTQADWTEDDPTASSYIENKPTPKTLTGGTNITVTENSSTITISATWQNAQADWTETDPNEPAYIQHKPSLATVATSGDYTDLSNTPTIPTVDQTYDGTSTNAQSGIAVASGISDAIGDLPTNLTSAQIEALKVALGVDETVLWSGMKTIGNDGAATYNLSESPLNFQYIKVYFCANDNTFGSSGNVGSSYTEWDTQIYTAPSTFLTVYMDGNASSTAITKYAINCDVSDIQTSTWTAHGYLNDATGNAKWFHIFKIVGRHRIASN